MPATQAERVFTKIVATIGPASNSRDRLAALIDAGVDVCRLNFSHGKLETHKQTLDLIREIANERSQAVAALGDLSGPKIRLNEVVGGKVTLERGAEVRIGRGDGPSDAKHLTITYPRIVDEVLVGQRVLIDDGLVRLLVVDKNAYELICACTVGGEISTRKGVNLPDSRLSVPALTEKDRRDLEWAIDNNLDYVALSFVRHPDDLRELRRIIDERKSKLNVIVKIEKSEALEHLDELVALSDGVMVARGDLGVEMDVWRVPLVQKALTARCREAGKPVIVATQMLQSMVSTPTPTRAEVSDVANAIFDATDAVMLSAETASGEYPIEAVEMMRRVAVTTEAYRRGELRPEPARSVSAHYRSTSAIANGAAEVALSLNARLVAVWSTSGETVRLVASRRLPMPVVGLTHDERVYRQLNLLYGVFPLRVPPMRNPIEMAATLDERLVSAGLAGVGDLVVVVTSTNPTTSGNTDTTLVHRVQAR